MQNQGHGQSKKRSSKNIDSPVYTLSLLNYSGVLTSPYEFYEKQDEREKALSESFKEIVSKTYPAFSSKNEKQFIWDMGSIDTKWKDRLSPFNMQTAGVKKNQKRMMNEKEFVDEWNHTYQRTKNQIIADYFSKKYKGEQLQKRIQIQISRCRQFDLFVYKTFMKEIYNLSDITDANVSSQPYQKQRAKDFDRPYLDKNMKILTTVNSMRKLNHDVWFMQELDPKTKQQLKKMPQYVYHIPDGNHADSIILLRRAAFANANEQDLIKQNENFIQKYIQKTKEKKQDFLTKFNFNLDSVFQVYGNILFLNLHLSSKKQKNPEQVKEVQVYVNKIIRAFPNMTIICGGDFNANVQRFEIDAKAIDKKQLNWYPDGKDAITVMKKRTLMQPQRHKGDKLDKSAKDFIFTNGQLYDTKCMLISGYDVSKDPQLLPNSYHPYDHYIVSAKFTMI